jgi:hypothetical protein
MLSNMSVTVAPFYYATYCNIDNIQNTNSTDGSADGSASWLPAGAARERIEADCVGIGFKVSCGGRAEKRAHVYALS